MASTRSRVVRVSLKGLFPEARFFGIDDLWVKSCTADASRCQPGELFVAFDDGRHDGHAMADQAVQRGVAAVLGERLLPQPIPQCLVPDSRAAYARLCEAVAGFPSDRTTSVGITGTHGKTTVQWLLASILEQAGHNVGVWGSLGRLDGRTASRCPIDAATPNSLTRWLARSLDHAARYCLVEASSRALAARTLDVLRLDVAIVTNCGRDHLAQHGTWENYQAAKARIFQRLKPQGTVVLNADDPGSRGWRDALERPVLTFGTAEGANVAGQILETHAGEQSMVLHLGDESAAVQTRMLGQHHLQNCLAAAAAALVLGIGTREIVCGIEALDSVPGRLERIDSGVGTAVYVDEARTPHSLSLVLSAVRRVTPGRVLVVLGGGYLPAAERARLGRTAERFADATVLSSHRLQRRAPLGVIHDLLDGFLRPARAQVMPDRARAICSALSQATVRDSVVLVGPQRGSGKRQALDLRDADIVRAWQEEFNSASGSSWATA